MSRNLLVKFVILLVVAALVYSVFWFFKSGQLLKQVNGFVSQNSNYVSTGEVAVSGFPLAQKVTIKDLKFTFPGSLLGKRQTIVKHLEAKAGIFSSDFTITLPEPVSVQDADNVSAPVEFNKEPEIKVSMADGRIEKFHYQDFGYRILDAEKKTIYAAGSSDISLEVVAGSEEKTVTKILVNIKDIEGFDVADIYKNVFEKRITEGLKTGEIVLGSAVVADPAVVPNSTVVATTDVSAPASPAVVADLATTPATTTDAVATDPAKVVDKMTATAADDSLVKSNFMAEIEYSVVPNKDDQKAQVPTDPTQIQEVPTQHNKTVKITNLEFSNPLYKISMNGEMHALADDNMPSGSLAIKVEKIDNLVNHLLISLNQMNEQKKPATTDVQSVDLAGNGTLTIDAYQNFLSKFSAGLNAVSKEVAAKNAVSKDDVAQFDIRREKNLEFLINETSIREILGKF